MQRRQSLILVIAALFLMPACLSSQASKAQGQGGQKMVEVRKMEITGEIAKSEYGYIIRGSKPAEIFTILNPEPKKLDELVASGRIVQLQVRIVSGDNIEIETIDAKKY